MKKKLLIGSFLIALNFNFLFSQVLIKDINEGFSSSSYSRRSITSGNNAYFPADDGDHGGELWISNGSNISTKMVKDINPGSADSDPKAFCFSGNNLFFIANDGVHGEELWKTDGTEAGTVLVKDIKQGSANGGIDVPFDEDQTFAALNGKIYFHADGGVWVSDGTTAGTSLFKAANVSFDIASSKGKVFFITREGFNDVVWATDGTTAGTISLYSGTPRDLTPSDLGLFFNDGSELYLSDGTSSGTILVEQIGTSSFGSFDFTESNASYKNKFYFVAEDENEANQIWYTDGTSVGTKQLTTIGVPFNSSFRYFKAVGDYLYFLFNKNDNEPRQLWRTDGTSAGTIKLLDFSGGGLNFIKLEDEPIGYNGKLYLAIETLSGGDTEVWSSNGTVAGTKREFVITTSFSFSQLTTGLMPITNGFLFHAEMDLNDDVGEELWGYAPPIINAFPGSIAQTGTIKCYGDKTVKLEVKTTGGTAPFTYKWNNANLSGAVLNNVGAGFYRVTVTDNTGGTSVYSKTVQTPDSIGAYALAYPSSAEIKNGRISAYISGSFNGPYSYLWNNGSTTDLLVDVGKGKYSFTITDIDGCKESASGEVKGLDSLKINFNVVKKLLCFGDETGVISSQIKGGLPPYQIEWLNKTQKDTFLLDLKAGKYTLKVSDSKGVLVEKSFELQQPSKLTTNITSTNATSGQKNGSATVSVLGGTSPYQYKWNTIPAQTSAKIENLDIGNYTVTITDKNGCSTIASISIKSGLGAIIEITNSVKCNGDKTGALNANVLGGNSPYNFKWSNGATSPKIENLAAGVYSVTITDKDGLTATTSKEITQPSKVSVSLSSTYTTGAQKTGKAKVNISGGVLPITYLWNTGQTTQEITNLGEGTYSITVTDANGCTGTGKINVKNTISTNDFAEHIGLKVYPNPAIDMVYIETVANGIEFSDYEIKDLSGKNLLSGVLNNNQISVERLSSGMFILILKDKNNPKNTAITNLIIIK